jgi:hypothetical protein
VIARATMSGCEHWSDLLGRCKWQKALGGARAWTCTTLGWEPKDEWKDEEK